MSKDKLIPELRFPEFKNEGEWETKEVGEIFDVTRGYVLAMSLVQENQSEENPYPVYSSQTKNNGLAGFYKDYLYEDAITWTTDGANAGDVNYREGKFYCTNVCGVLLNKDGFANKCISELINSVSKNYVSYVGNPKLMNGVMSQIKIPVPKIKEQQKIASCLSSLDDLIAAHSQKLELLKDHKKGLMQNLFPQEGEKVPKYRFKEFEKDGEWVEKKLESLTRKIGDGIHTTPKYDDSGEYYFINGNNLIEGRIVVDEKTKKVSYSEYELHKKELTEKTILLSINGTIGNVAFYKKEKVVLGKSACYIIPKDNFNNVFLYYSLQSPRISNYFISELTGSTIKNLSLKSIREAEFNFPSPEEQQKIAICLSSLDALITAQAEKIEQLKLHKKGLMQGLFPKIKE